MAMPFRINRTKPPAPDSLWGIGDSIPAPEAIVKEGDSGWAAWEEAQEQQEKHFAQTEPAPEGVRLSPEEAGWANTVPHAPNAAAPAQPAPARAPDPGVTLEAALRVSRRNNRICPRPQEWQAFVALLPPRKTRQGVQHPPPAVTGPAWNAAPERAKRICFREQIEWAERVGKLKEVIDFMEALPEASWLHAGER